MSKTIFSLAIASIALVACKKQGCTDPLADNYNDKAKKDDNSCTYTQDDEDYDVPTTYVFTDENGNNTVSYSGQTERLNQLREMVALFDQGKTSTINAQDLKDMFANTGDNGNGNFSFSSSKQLKNKCFALDVDLFEGWMDSIAVASQSHGDSADYLKAGLVYTGSSSYLVSPNGVEYKQLIEKGLMGAVFMHNAINHYFADGQMDVDNTAAVDAANGKYYTTMEHHFDEAFGYFGVPTNFPNTIPVDFWGKYCNKQDGLLQSNNGMMSNFLKGRAAIANNDMENRDIAIANIREMWEDISANQALTYLNDAITAFGNDEAKFLHVLSEAYAFCHNLRYSSEEKGRLAPAEHAAIMSLFKANFRDMTLQDLNEIKVALQAKY